VRHSHLLNAAGRRFVTGILDVSEGLFRPGLLHSL
jgi:hypothetical protein